MDYLTEYNPEWPTWYARIEGYLRPRLAGCIRIEHIGSTSIVGMVAKPIIDIDLVVAEGQMPAAIASIEQAGYLHRGDLGVPGREAFKPVLAAPLSLPAHHLYACAVSCAELRRHLSFRDYLSTHPDEALRLAQFKRHLAFEQRLNRQEYIEGKADVVSEIAAKALAWYADTRVSFYSAEFCFPKGIPSPQQEQCVEVATTWHWFQTT